MKVKLSFYVVYLVFLLVALCGQSAAITNGDEPDRYSHPWVVILRAKGFDFNFCSATLVDRQWVLTNAHCLEFMKDALAPGTPVYALLGAHDMLDDNEQGRQLALVDRMYEHPNFSSPLAHDIGLMHLAKPAKVGQKTISVVPRIASAAVAKFIIKRKRRCAVFASGTQLTSSGTWRGDVNPVSRLDVRLYDCSTRQEFFNTAHADDHICYKSVKRRSSTCGGDSGGTVVCRHHGQWTLLAANTFGFWQPRCRDGYQGGNLVYKSKRFIDDTTGLNLL